MQLKRRQRREAAKPGETVRRAGDRRGGHLLVDILLDMPLVCIIVCGQRRHGRPLGSLGTGNHLPLIPYADSIIRLPGCSEAICHSGRIRMGDLARMQQCPELDPCLGPCRACLLTAGKTIGDRQMVLARTWYTPTCQMQ